MAQGKLQSRLIQMGGSRVGQDLTKMVLELMLTCFFEKMEYFPTKLPPHELPSASVPTYIWAFCNGMWIAAACFLVAELHQVLEHLESLALWNKIPFSKHFKLVWAESLNPEFWERGGIVKEKISPPGMQALDGPWQANISFVLRNGCASRIWKSWAK